MFHSERREWACLGCLMLPAGRHPRVQSSTDARSRVARENDFERASDQQVRGVLFEPACGRRTQAGSTLEHAKQSVRELGRRGVLRDRAVDPVLRGARRRRSPGLRRRRSASREQLPRRPRARSPRAPKQLRGTRRWPSRPRPPPPACGRGSAPRRRDRACERAPRYVAVRDRRRRDRDAAAVAAARASAKPRTRAADPLLASRAGPRRRRDRDRTSSGDRRLDGSRVEPGEDGRGAPVPLVHEALCVHAREAVRVMRSRMHLRCTSQPTVPAKRPA